MNQSVHALIAEDSESMRMVIRETLKMAGYNVFEAADGKDALRLAKSNHFDLVITDINIPVMDGLELIRKLRALPQYRYTPILALTTEKGGDTKQLGKVAGATGWVTKPFNPEKLTQVLNILVDTSRPAMTA